MVFISLGVNKEIGYKIIVTKIFMEERGIAVSIILQAETCIISNEPYVYIDVRTKTAKFASGKLAYEHSHIPGAVFLDMKKDLSEANSFAPDVHQLAQKLGEHGISEQTKIVIYDQGNQRAASKAWYIFHYLGHQQVYILQGGFPAWTAVNGETTKEIPNRDATMYKPNVRQEVVTTIAGVKEKLKKGNATLIDARAPERYEGITEPKYEKAGHIPGAVNYHAQNMFSTAGMWKSKVELEKHFTGLKRNHQLIVSCGSGNSACMNLVALKEAGYDQVSLYAGGFSEWIQDDRNDVATGKDVRHHEK